MAIKQHLGTKLAAAMVEKGVGPAEVARHFDVKQPSVQGWMRTGRILKSRLPALSAYFNKPLEWWLLSEETHKAAQPPARYDSEDIKCLSEFEKQLLGLFRKLSKLNQARLTERAQTLLDEQVLPRK